MSKRARIIALSAVGVVVLVVAAGLLWWFTRDEAPEAVDLESAVARVEADDNTTSTPRTAEPVDRSDGDDSTTTSSPTDASNDTSTSDNNTATTTDDQPDGAAGALAGQWTVETAETGTDVSGEPAVSFAGFRVDEVLAGGIGDFTAVGRTANVWGSVTLSDKELVEATVEVDFTTLRTDDSHRDHHVLEALNIDEHPIGMFTLIEPLPIPASAADGEPFSGAATGELTIKGVTNRAVFNLDAQRVSDKIVVVGTSDVVFADYGVTTPSAPIVVSVEDHGIMEFQLILTR